jgi:hypothetical protein
VGSTISTGAGWQIVRPKYLSVGGVAFAGFFGATFVGALAAGIWALASDGSVGTFLACLAAAVAGLAGIRYVMGSFIAVSEAVVAQGRWPGKVLRSIDRSAVVRARWHAAGRSNCGQLLDAEGVVLMTFDPLISKGQSRMIAELLGVPFTAP